MASSATLHSCFSSFHGQSPILSSPISTRFPTPSSRNQCGFSVKASNVVLVEKSEAEKVQRLKTTYLEKIVPLLKEEFAYTNMHQVPKVEKIVVNCGIGEAAQNSKGLDAAMKDLSIICGQRPVKTRARVSIATFKLREGQPIGLAVTLRGNVSPIIYAH
ncbi:hypothetical protein IFM89_024671 [Coptis chinensis]|uniref:Large ribosomal subunit protein uL5 N-terminal domain-containing protein n=1 Tax=Coptis chinensis TaxID=261450 RepID=A0A835IFQ7_9MAGN|nr:hypothetical protein IFM89_023736 [Coptis chinensis]KAF9615582.1 hypothetical protein IFM89_024671 [Coptis chinensis]